MPGSAPEKRNGKIRARQRGRLLVVVDEESCTPSVKKDNRRRRQYNSSEEQVGSSAEPVHSALNLHSQGTYLNQRRPPPLRDCQLSASPSLPSARSLTNRYKLSMWREHCHALCQWSRRETCSCRWRGAGTRTGSATPR